MEQVFELIKSQKKYDYLMKRFVIIMLSVANIMVSAVAYGEKAIIFSYFGLSLLGIDQITAYRTVITYNSRKISFAKKFAYMPTDFTAYRQKTIKQLLIASLLYTIPGFILSIAIAYADGIAIHILPRIAFTSVSFLVFMLFGLIDIYVNLGKNC